jgi:hypothetical protein
MPPTSFSPEAAPVAPRAIEARALLRLSSLHAMLTAAAGGLGVLLHADYFASRLPPSIRYRALAQVTPSSAAAAPHSATASSALAAAPSTS